MCELVLSVKFQVIPSSLLIFYNIILTDTDGTNILYDVLTDTDSTNILYNMREIPYLK